MKSLSQSVASEFSFRLDSHSGVPVYRQLIDQVQAAIATGVLSVGNQLPTVRRVAVDLAINPNTVVRAYREMELRGIARHAARHRNLCRRRTVFEHSKEEQARLLSQLVTEFVARAGAAGFKVSDLIEALRQLPSEAQKN